MVTSSRPSAYAQEPYDRKLCEDRVWPSSGFAWAIVQYPETVGYGPQLFPKFTAHRAPVTQVSLTLKFLSTVCSDYNHVRAWSVIRFRVMINIQPGSTPLASFAVLSLDVRTARMFLWDSMLDLWANKMTNSKLWCRRFSRTLPRLLCAWRLILLDDITATDGSPVITFLVHDSEGSSRME